MFVALRDLRFARGRFFLIGSVVALITILVGFLSGLTGGLASQNVSAVLSMPGDRIVFSAPAKSTTAVSFSDSVITSKEINAWSSARGVTNAQPVGISQTRAESTAARVALAVFASNPALTARLRPAQGRLACRRPLRNSSMWARETPLPSQAPCTPSNRSRAMGGTATPQWSR